MSTPPSPGWWPIAATVASTALEPGQSASALADLLEGLARLHGWTGAWLGERPASGSGRLVTLGSTGQPSRANNGSPPKSAWTEAVAKAIDADPRPPGVVCIDDRPEGEAPWVLVAFGAREMTSATRADVDEALALARRIDAGRRRQDAERLTAQRTECIIEATQAGTWEWNILTGTARMNRRWAEIMGRELAELEPVSVDTWISHVHPDDLPRCSAKLEAHIAGRTDRYEAVYRMRHKDGRWIWVHDRGRIVRYTRDGRPELMAGSHSDISELKQYEAALEASNLALRTGSALLDAASRLAQVGAWTYRPEGEGLFWSEVVGRIHGLPSNRTPSLEQALGLLVGDGRIRIKEAFRQSLADGDAWDLDVQIRTATGQARWLRVHGEPEFVDGRIVGILGAMQDITEMRAMQEALRAHNADLESRVRERTLELEHARRLAEDASRAKDEFLTNISHELRSPLHSILGFTGLVLDEGEAIDRATLLRFVEKSRGSASELLKLVNDLLDAAKIESGRLSIAPEPVGLGALTREVAGEFEVAASNKHLQIEIDPGEDLTVNADRTRLAQALRNVVSNAVRFSPQGGRIRLRARRDDAGMARLTVEDQGPGIPESELEGVFDRFTQSSRTKTGAGGTGLGLPIARGIVELHGGRLWAERPGDGGTAFCFELPAA